MSASFQESFLSSISENSFGAPFMFQPDAIRKGKGIREPADLAWVCGRTVILINMTGGGKSFAHQVSHNLRQMTGWLRMWSSGHVLVGQNAWVSFALELGDIDKILLLSVVDGEDACALFHWDWTSRRGNDAEKKTVGVVSLPQEVLLELAKRGGTALDLTDYILQLASLSRPVPNELALAILADQHHNAIRSVRADMGQVEERDDDHDTNSSQQLVSGLRAAYGLDPRRIQSSEILQRFSVFNDLDWEESIRLTFTITDLTIAVRDVPVGEVGPTCISAALEFDVHFFIVSAADIRQTAQLTEATEAELENLRDREPIWIARLITGRPEVQLYTTVLTIYPFTRESAVSRNLANITPDLEGSAVREHGYPLTAPTTSDAPGPHEDGDAETSR